MTMCRHYEPSIRLDYGDLDDAIEMTANKDGEYWRGACNALYLVRNMRFNTAEQLIEELRREEGGEDGR